MERHRAGANLQSDSPCSPASGSGRLGTRLFVSPLRAVSISNGFHKSGDLAASSLLAARCSSEQLLNYSASLPPANGMDGSRNRLWGAGGVSVLTPMKPALRPVPALIPRVSSLHCSLS